MSYLSFHQSMSERFGCKVYKLSLDGGMSCPNRDGTLSDHGCIFCSEHGSGDFAARHDLHLEAQMEKAKQRVGRKLRDGKYIAYFQSFTNTYAPVSYLEPLFRKAIAAPDIVALAIATRPDCLPREVVQLLANLNREKPVLVELGLQSIHAQTAQYIRRGYALSCFEEAVQHLKAEGLELVVHMILGLPGETREMMLETARYIGASGADGIKLQLLHVLEGTDLAKEFQAGRVQALTMEEYISILEDCLRVLPPDMVIHRLTGDGPKKSLIAPLWSADKKRVLNEMQKAFRRDGVRQGSLWQAAVTKEKLP